MTAVSKATSAVLVLAVLALVTAGAASADAFRPTTHHADPFVSTRSKSWSAPSTIRC